MNRLNKYTLGALIATLIAAAVVYGLGGNAEHMGIVLAFGTALLAATPPVVTPRSAPKRIELPPAPSSRRRENGDDDDTGEGGEVLAEEPPTKPLPRTPQRVELPRETENFLREGMKHHFGFLCDGDESARAEQLADEGLLSRIRGADGKVSYLVSRKARTLIAGLGMATLFVLGCSPSALQTHATIASITGRVFDEACAEVEVARSREQHAIADGPLDREASGAAVDAVRARWAPALASCELAADTHDAWVTALALAAAGAPFTLSDGVALAERALEVWRSLTATLATAGVEMPPLPPELVALTGGAL